MFLVKARMAPTTSPFFCTAGLNQRSMLCSNAAVGKAEQAKRARTSPFWPFCVNPTRNILLSAGIRPPNRGIRSLSAKERPSKAEAFNSNTMTTAQFFPLSSPARSRSACGSIGTGVRLRSPITKNRLIRAPAADHLLQGLCLNKVHSWRGSAARGGHGQGNKSKRPNNECLHDYKIAQIRGREQ